MNQGPRWHLVSVMAPAGVNRRLKRRPPNTVRHHNPEPVLLQVLGGRKVVAIDARMEAEKAVRELHRD